MYKCAHEYTHSNTHEHLHTLAILYNAIQYILAIDDRLYCWIFCGAVRSISISVFVFRTLFAHIHGTLTMYSRSSINTRKQETREKKKKNTTTTSTKRRKKMEYYMLWWELKRARDCKIYFCLCWILRRVNVYCVYDTYGFCSAKNAFHGCRQCWLLPFVDVDTVERCWLFLFYFFVVVVAKEKHSNENHHQVKIDSTV